jgi:hypothetical protein
MLVYFHPSQDFVEASGSGEDRGFRRDEIYIYCEREQIICTKRTAVANDHVCTIYPCSRMRKVGRPAAAEAASNGDHSESSVTTQHDRKTEVIPV